MHLQTAQNDNGTGVAGPDSISHSACVDAVMGTSIADAEPEKSAAHLNVSLISPGKYHQHAYFIICI